MAEVRSPFNRGRGPELTDIHVLGLVRPGHLAGGGQFSIFTLNLA